MLSTLRDLISPRRRKLRRQIKGMFGPYVSPILVEQLINKKAAVLPNGTPIRQKVRVIVFFYPDWGFSDGSLPKLRTILEEIGDALDEVSQSGLTICLVGEETKEEFDRIRALLEAAAATPDFDGFRVGVAEGISQGRVDVCRITGEAFKNGRGASPRTPAIVSPSTDPPVPPPPTATQ